MHAQPHQRGQNRNKSMRNSTCDRQLCNLYPRETEIPKEKPTNVYQRQVEKPSCRSVRSQARLSNMEASRKIAEKQSNKTGELIIAYQCFDCSWFHIGHADESQKIIRKLPDLPSLPTTCPRVSSRSMRAGAKRRSELFSDCVLLSKVPTKVEQEA